MNRSIMAQWMIATGAFISLAPFMNIVGIPMYIIGVITFWTTKEHIVDKISWTVLPVIIYIVLVKIIYAQ